MRRFGQSKVYEKQVSFSMAIVIIVSFWQATLQPFLSSRFAKKKVPFSMDKGNGKFDRFVTIIFTKTGPWEQQE